MELLTGLYEHQVKAVEKLSKIKVGALYMEQGTGKTRTALELIDIRLNKGRINHVLWLCPCSVKENLRRDVIKHTGSDCSDFITICGIETLSISIRENTRLLKLVQERDVYLIVDESNLVKNHHAIRTHNIIRLSNFCKYKLILNGTPISRCEKDLYSQWYILDWRILGYQSFWSFAANHLEYDEQRPGRIRRCLNVDYLVQKIAPYTYQVKKSECLDLPDKTYTTSMCWLTRAQEEHYQEVADNLLFDLDEMKPSTIYRLFTGLQSVISGFRVDCSGRSLKREPFFKNPLDNPRIQELLRLVDGMTEKTIIFCKYTQEIDDILKVLNNKYGEGAAVPFYGKLNLKNRQESMDKFSDTAQFFVANKDCAGYGLNLQFCSYVIYYSNDWNYATRAQSEDRVHRIGQEKNVHILDVLCGDTLDERILDCLSRKERLVDRFKNEIDNTKDNKEEFINMFIYKKDSKGRTRVKNKQQVRNEALNSLKEENNAQNI